MYLQLAGAEDRLGEKILSTAASLQLESGLILLTFIRAVLQTSFTSSARIWEVLLIGSLFG